MKKVLVLLVVSLLLIVVAGTALAANDGQVPTPTPSDQELYQQMYDACHGPNGFRSKYFADGNAPMGYGGMMGGYWN
ncbi:MAG: hypothetical protein AAGU27_12695 [Dehalobacterium sp.]